MHVCGGTAALVGTVLLGPRIGRYDPETGKPQGIPGHSTVLTTLGFMILWFGYGTFSCMFLSRVSLCLSIYLSLSNCGLSFFAHYLSR